MKQEMYDKQSSKRRRIALLWFLIVGGVIATLLYFEQVAVIYVLSTVGLIVLLLVVAFSDLEKVGLADETTSTSQPSDNDTKAATLLRIVNEPDQSNE